jgi:hypothetical protein
MVSSFVRCLGAFAKPDNRSGFFDEGETISEIAPMKSAGIVAVTDDGKPVATVRQMRQVMDYCRALGLPVIDPLRAPVAFCRRRDASCGWG